MVQFVTQYSRMSHFNLSAPSVPLTQHNTTPHHTTQHNTTQHITTPHITTQHNTTPQNTSQHHTTHHNTTHITTQHNTTPHNTTPHITTPHHTSQHNTTPHNILYHISQSLPHPLDTETELWRFVLDGRSAVAVRGCTAASTPYQRELVVMGVVKGKQEKTNHYVSCGTEMQNNVE